MLGANVMTTTKSQTAPGDTADATDGGVDPADVSGAGARPMRADAVKNRQRILEAAEATFASEGLSVPIDTVAERAGSGWARCTATSPPKRPCSRPS